MVVVYEETNILQNIFIVLLVPSKSKWWHMHSCCHIKCIFSLTVRHKMSPHLNAKSILSVCAQGASSLHITLVCWILDSKWLVQIRFSMSTEKISQQSMSTQRCSQCVKLQHVSFNMGKLKDSESRKSFFRLEGVIRIKYERLNLNESQ